MIEYIIRLYLKFLIWSNHSKMSKLFLIWFEKKKKILLYNHKYILLIKRRCAPLIFIFDLPYD